MLSFNQAIAERVVAKASSRADKFTHVEVGYQDHPHDGEQCDKCWKYRSAQSNDEIGNDPEPSCLKVQSPISPTGWCQRFQQQATPGMPGFSSTTSDPTDDLIAEATGVGKAVSFFQAKHLQDGLGVAMAPNGKWSDTVSSRRMSKRANGAMTFDQALAKYSANQPRDTRGRWTSVGGDEAPRVRPAGGAFNAPPRVSSGQGTEQGSRGRYWVYDHDWNLLDTYKTLTAAKNRGMAHTRATNMPANVYDSVGRRETSTLTFRPGVYATAEAKWRTDEKGKTAWRDTSEQDALIDRFVRERADYERKHGPIGKAMIYGEFRKRLAKAGPREIYVKAFNPDEARDTKGKWTAIEDAQKTAKDVGRIMDKARLDSAHNAISPDHDRNYRLLSTWELNEYASEPFERVQDAKDFKPGGEHYDSLTDEERQAYRQQLHEDLDGIGDEMKGHRDSLVAGLEKYSERVDAYAVRVKDTLAKVKDRIAQGQTAKAFDPDEPRDKDGEWTSGGDGGKPAKDQGTRGRFLSGRVDSRQKDVREKEQRVRDLQAQIATATDKGNIHDHLVFAHADLAEARRSLKEAQDEHDHPVRSLFEAVAMRDYGIRVGKAVSFDQVMKYSPDQPRDARGRFAGGGGGGGAAGKKPVPRATADASQAGDKVKDYASRLEASVGEPEFERVYAQLKADKSIKTDEAKQIARAMGMNGRRSKGDAMHAIWYRHQNLVIQEAKARATGGRTAA